MRQTSPCEGDGIRIALMGSENASGCNRSTKEKSEMRKFTVVLAALLAVMALPLMAQSNYHYNENMNCSDCHSMHASAHNNLTDGSAITTPNVASSPNRTINPYYPAPNPGAG